MPRKSKGKCSKSKAQVPKQTSAVVPPPLPSDDETTDDEALPISKKPEKCAKAGWDKILEAFKKSSGSASVAEIGDADSAGQQPSASYQRCGLTFTKHASPPEAFKEQRDSDQHLPPVLVSPLPDNFPRLTLPLWTPPCWHAVEARKRELERRAAEPDPPFSFSFVRDTLLKYERVDNWLKDVYHEYLKLARWKRPYYTGAFLTVVLGSTWIGFLLHLLLYTALIYIFSQSFKECLRGSDERQAANRSQGWRKFNVNVVPRMMKLNMRVSKTFQEISTAFDKTHSLLTWKNPGTTLCLLLSLLVLVGIAFWQGQAFAVQITVTLILLKLFVADYLCHVYPEAAKYDLIGRAWDMLPVRPIENSERGKSLG